MYWSIWYMIHTGHDSGTRVASQVMTVPSQALLSAVFSLEYDCPNESRISIYLISTAQ
jgi:hypothetical protein